MHHDNPPADTGDIDRPGNTVSPVQSHLPQLTLEMFDMRLSNPLKANRFNPLRQTQKRGLHIFRQRGDLSINNCVQGFNGPRPSVVGIHGR